MDMSDPLPLIDQEGLSAATAALTEQLRAQAQEQRAYLHSFVDGRISLELEWVDPQQWAYAVVLAYLASTQCR
ncbi:hypothetical protein [Microvirga arabica]|uniref:hypothetical protein n=1 Tax=Microvirga arabica TaxID=1128671 RepID=UPI00193A41AF|nr:hypothetical protein [Microvirga arabica]MBM1174714.1 hypothetical protein [Microvirga arabica]